MSELDPEEYGLAKPDGLHEIVVEKPVPTEVDYNISVPKALHQGYDRFRKENYQSARDKYAMLEEGQSPQTLIIACADSRVDPGMIFDTSPGELFVIRNVAALVPPYEADRGLHGVSAAMEYAVKVLKVKDIVVMGHGLCGGVNACINEVTTEETGLEFVPQWVELAAGARRTVNGILPKGTEAQRQLLGEYETIRISLKNLLSFPFVRQLIDDGALTIHGAWYSVHMGSLRWRDPETGRFVQVEELT
jgi:carbonic anhydrase